VARLCRGSRFMATPSWEPAPRLRLCSRLPRSDTWELCRTQASPVFLWSWGPWDHTVPRGFHAPLSHWSDVPQRSRLLKVPILCSVALSLARSGRRRPLPRRLSSRISPRIHFSARPTFQKVVVFLFRELLLFFSSISCWICRCSEWFDPYPAEFLRPNEIQVSYSSAILLHPPIFVLFCLIPWSVTNSLWSHVKFKKEKIVWLMTNYWND